MRKTEMREVEVGYCDLCEEEATHFNRCAVCKREMCNKDGGAAHSAYSLEIYRYVDGRREISIHVCKECSEVVPSTLSIGQLIDVMLRDEAVLERDATGVLRFPDDPNFKSPPLKAHGLSHH